MILTLPLNAETWETIATIQLAQSLNNITQEKAFTVNCLGANTDHRALTELAGVRSTVPGVAYELKLDEAYRAAEQGTGWYGDVLARSSQCHNLFLQQLIFPGIEAHQNGDVVLCPFAMRREFHLPANIWTALVRLLRSYGHRVVLLGEQGERKDQCMFFESDMYCDAPVKDKLEMLAGAKMIVGVPNAWTWASTAWKKKLVMLHPDDIPRRKWFPLIDEGNDSWQRWLLYQSYNLQVPLFLVGVRRHIAGL